MIPLWRITKSDQGVILIIAPTAHQAAKEAADRYCHADECVLIVEPYYGNEKPINQWP